MDNSIREQLAELEHDQWCAWASKLLPIIKESVEAHSDDCECGRCARVRRWTSLLVPYSQLSDEQKDQDRVWTDKVIRIIERR